MAENEVLKKAVDDDEDWAVLPFDEAEDVERWAKLELELDELAEKVASHEAVFGEILMENTLSEMQTKAATDGWGDPF